MIIAIKFERNLKMYLQMYKFVNVQSGNINITRCLVQSNSLPFHKLSIKFV